MDWLIALLVATVLVLPLTLAWVILSWHDWRKPKENARKTSLVPEHGKPR